MMNREYPKKKRYNFVVMSRLIGVLSIFVSSFCLAHQRLGTLQDFEFLEQCLQNDSITAISSFYKTKGSQPTHSIKLVTLESGIKGLFKTGEYHYAEVAAYRLSKLLNIFLVPPTVFRTIEGIQGSLQLYMNAQDLASFHNPLELLKHIEPKMVSDMKVFYYLAGQWDTHYGNQLIEKQNKKYRLWLIDNSSILHRSYSIYKGVTFIEKGTNDQLPSDNSHTFPFDKACTIEGKHALDIFHPYIPSKKHLESLARKEQLTYSLWKNTLWLFYETDSPSRISRYTSSYYCSTLEACKTLSYDNLSQVWAEWIKIDPSSGHELIQLILTRRDELLKNSLSNTILEH